MSKFDITHKCGHQEIIDIKGKVKLRENKAEFYGSRLCKECYIKEKNEQVLKQIEIMEMSQLVGSEKQVTWANSIRSEKIELLEKRIAETECFIKTNLGIDSNEKAENFMKVNLLNKDILLAQIKRIKDSKKTIENLKKETDAKKIIDTRFL